MGAMVDYDEVSGPYSDYRRHIGLPDSSLPVSEASVHTSQEQVMPLLGQYKKNENNEQDKSMLPANINNNYNNNNIIQSKGEPAFPMNSTVQFQNGDYIGVDSPSNDNAYLLWRHSDTSPATLQ